MPRKKTIQPEPLYTLTTDNGIVAEVRDFATRKIGPGMDKQFLSEELDWQVLLGLCAASRRRKKTPQSEDHGVLKLYRPCEAAGNPKIPSFKPN